MEGSCATDKGPQLSVPLVACELEASLDWLVKIRWIAGVGVLLATIVATVLGLELALIPLCLIGVGILAYNALFSRWASRLKARSGVATPAARTLARLQITADWIAMTLLIHFSGGIESPAILYFFFHIVLAAILLSVRDTYFFAVLATLLVGGTALLEYLGALSHIAVVNFLPYPLYQNPIYVAGVFFFFTSTVFVAAYLGTRTTTHLRRREAEVVTLGQNLERAYRRQQALYASAQAVGSTLDLQEVLDRLTRSTKEAMSVAACAIRLLDETGNRLCLVSTYGMDEAYWQKGCLLVDQNPIVREVLDGKIVAIGDITTSAQRLQYPAEAIAAGIRSTLTVPLPGRNGPLGIIRAYCIHAHRFTDDDAAFLSAVASHGSVAIENALAYQAIQNMEEAKRKFVLMVTHELRSPVGVVHSLLNTLAGGYAGKLTDLQQDMIERAIRRVDQLQTLINDLLDLAAGKTGLRVVPDVEPVDLRDVVHRVVERYTVPAAEKHVTLQLQMDDDRTPIVVKATTEEMDRVFNNLVSNAVKYTPENGTVIVTVRLAEGKAQVTVADTGIGIPEDALPHLFEEFYRAPNAKAQVKEGTGLGLVITKEIVTRYGGYIHVQSMENKGTTFVVTLPLVSDN